MDCNSSRLPYRQTNCFSNIALDYLDHVEGLKPLYAYSPSLQGIQKAIDNRQNFSTDRKVLVEDLNNRYAADATPAVRKNIDALLLENTFTITTAHQPNIFTGPLYFIYKVLHAIRLAEYCRTS